MRFKTDENLSAEIAELLNYAGIIVLRPHLQPVPRLLKMIARLLPLFETEPLVGKLWIVDDSRIRIRD